MKKIFLAAIAIGTFVGNTNAQFYVAPQVGYSFPFAGTAIGTMKTGDATASPSTIAETNITSSFGTGFNGGLSLGYMFSEHLGLDLGVSYNTANALVSSSTDTKTSAGLGLVRTDKSTTTVSGNQIRLTPSLIVRAGKEGFSPYGRVGLVLPVAGETMQDVKNETIVTAGSAIAQQVDVTAKAKIQGQMSIGFNGALGATFNLSEHLGVFGELAFTALSIKGKSVTFTEYTTVTTTVAGTTTTTLDSRKAYQNQINYVDKLDGSSNNPSYNANFDQDKPTDSLAPASSNYNSLGVNLGVRYSF